MAIAMGRFGRLKRWIGRQIKGFFVGIKNKVIRAIRGPSTEENDIALEVNPEINVFEVCSFLSSLKIQSFFYILAFY